MRHNQHTPTPWRAATEMSGVHQGFSIMAPWEGNDDEKDPYHPLIARTIHGRGDAPMEVARANAAFIVQAVNNYDAMILALDKVQKISAHMKSERSTELNKIASVALAHIQRDYE